MEPLENLQKVRLQKLEKIKALGVNPYPTKYQKIPIAEVRNQKLDTKAQIAGRLMALRGHGKLVFADLVDSSGKIQIAFKQDILGPEKMKFIELLDIGDFIGCTGDLFQTQAGELTVLIKDYTLLTKSLRPLPSQWYGLKDIEERYRKRYLDFIINPEVKKTFEIRSKVINSMRKFLTDKGYLEIDSPILQPIYGGGLAKPFKTYHNALGIPLYLRISTELYLKRLIVGGFEKVFEIARVFRNEGMDKNHNPEFTMLETMEAYINYQDNMQILEEMIAYAVKEAVGSTKVNFQGKEIDFKTPWKRITMNQAVKETTGIDFSQITDLKEALLKAQELNLKLEDYQKNTTGLILAVAFEEKVEKNLLQPTIIYDFPVETSPLAKKCPKDPRFVERFEHYIAGMECSNNYSELNDPTELSQRFQNERKKERLGDTEAHQTDTDFIEAMEYGMPPTSGLGPGIDRLIMIITNSQNLRDVIPFPTLKPEKNSLDDGLRGDQETKMNNHSKTSTLPDENTKRFIAVLNKKYDKGKLMNALGHMTAGLLGKVNNLEEVCFLEYTDKDGGLHSNISHFPFIVLEADSSNQIRKVRKEAIENGLYCTDFTSTMTIGTSMAQMEATKESKEEELDYLGVCLFGETEKLKPLTKNFSLFKN